MGRIGRVATIVGMAVLGTLAGSAVALAGGGGHCAPEEASTDLVVLEDACFSPSTVHADAGTTITFESRDPFAHNVVGTGWGHWEDLDRGDRFEASFADEGLYPFACTIHPGMNGVIVVGDQDGAAVATTTGSSTATTPPAPGDGPWLAAGAVGLIVGAAAGAGLVTVRRRREAGDPSGIGEPVAP
jgi:plastocyanin